MVYISVILHTALWAVQTPAVVDPADWAIERMYEGLSLKSLQANDIQRQDKNYQVCLCIQLTISDPDVRVAFATLHRSDVQHVHKCIFLKLN